MKIHLKKIKKSRSSIKGEWWCRERAGCSLQILEEVGNCECGGVAPCAGGDAECQGRDRPGGLEAPLPSELHFWACHGGG